MTRMGATNGETGPLEALADPDAWPALGAALGDWVPTQRWFQGKARVVTGVRVADAALLAGEPDVLLLVVDVSYATGGGEHYQVLLAAGGDGPTPLVATVSGADLVDALDDPGACRALAALALEGGTCRTGTGGEIKGAPVRPGTVPAAGDVRRLGVEQSNSSAVLAGQQILKVFRRLEVGLNPDVELTRGLTEQGFAHVPAQLGALLLHAGEGQRALAVLSAFATGAREGWALACAEAERVAAGAASGELARQAGDLGAVVARMHAALRDAFGAHAARTGQPQSWAESMQRQARAVLAAATARAPEATAAATGAAEALLGRLAAPAALDDVGPLVRTHGDLHLGQVLADERAGWLVLDFEGEPARPLAERRLPHSPLRDVAGMLRSFDYAAAHADRDVPAELAGWRDRLRAAFWDGYAALARPAGLLPDEDATAALLDAFELDKAVYELGYELANRPGWVGIPVGGILRVLDGR